MKGLYLIDVNNLCISRINASNEKINTIINDMNNTLDDRDVFTIGSSNEKDFIVQLKNIIIDLETRQDKSNLR